MGKTKTRNKRTMMRKMIGMMIARAPNGVRFCGGACRGPRVLS